MMHRTKMYLGRALKNWARGLVLDQRVDVLVGCKVQLEREADTWVVLTIQEFNETKPRSFTVKITENM